MQTSSRKIFNLKIWFYLALRQHSTLNSYKSSHEIRKRFLDYFNKENNHSFVKSSPIVPFCDATVPFVNAGMNQFKGIFLGLQDPISTKVANTQKCARVGGKHNDLNIIGTDGYHHTFFEMLGNWSFGDYFKKEACELAWNLLTGPYALNPNKLYVTYFGGHEALNLEPDLQCRDIWRNIGIPDEHILPFGINDNFWEMGPTGPCGPCTEIHIDRSESDSKSNRGHHINKGFSDLTELWNIVFIQYNRIASGAVLSLPKHHVDTGMGLERLVAVLQKQKSNYDTDLFVPLISAIQKNSNGGVKVYNGSYGTDEQADLDTAYRILADHSRLITVCLADGMIPDQNSKLRRILRKALVLTEKYFNADAALLKALCTAVSDSLGETYPEITKNMNNVHRLISHEQEVLQALRLGASKQWQNILADRPELLGLDIIEFPGLVLGYKEIQNAITNGNKELTSELAYKLCDTYGFEEDVIRKLANINHMTFDKSEFDQYVDMKKSQSKQLSSRFTDKAVYDLISVLQKNVPPTDDSFKYTYQYDNKYIFPNLNAKIQAIVTENNVVPEIRNNVCECSLILDKSSFYYESGGQEFDSGKIVITKDVHFNVESVNNINGYIMHNGKFVLKSNEMQDFCVKKGDVVSLEINPERRLNNMRNHTATHLLLSAIAKTVGDCVIAQASSKVCQDYLSLGVAIYGTRLTLDQLKDIETIVRNVIVNGAPVSTRVVNSQQLLSLESVTLVPGEVYPDTGIRLLEINADNFHSREACCGTHVLDTMHLEEFCITRLQNISRGITVIHAVTGESAVEALNQDGIIKDKIENLKKRISEGSNIELLTDLQSLRAEITSTTYPISHVTKLQSLEIIEDLIKKSKQSEHQNLLDFIDVEMSEVMNSVLKNNENYLVHNLVCSSLMKDVKLEKVTRYCKDKPVIIFSYSNGSVKARCCVPKEYVTKNFDAKKWLSTAAKLFGSVAAPPKGQDPQNVCNIKSTRVLEPEWYDLLEKAAQATKEYAKQHLNNKLSK